MTNPDELQRYAEAVLNAKGIPEDPLGLELTMRSLRESLATTYHAVALDVDGTVTEHVEEGLPKSMVDSLIGVLKHGAYLLFVTGGGRTTATRILHQLTSSLEGRILRRIHAITGSGCHRLSFGADGDIHAERLSKPLRELLGEDPYAALLSNLREGLSHYFETQEKACGIRLVSKEETPIAELSQIVGNRFDSLGEELKTAGVRLVSGRWGDKLAFDVSSTDKDLALTRFYTDLDFLDVPILRIGDQGAVGGNDYSFLDSQHGFSVGTLGSVPSRCFPVYNAKEGRLLHGVEGTRYLLSNLHWGARLTLPPFLVEESKALYRTVFDELRHRSRELVSELAGEWGKRAVDILDPESVRRVVDSRFGNVFDHKSGAIWLTEVEWSTLQGLTIGDVFRENDGGVASAQRPALLRSMYLDSGVILRGPRYYWGLSHTASRELASLVADETLRLHTLVLEEIDPSYSKRTFRDWKLELGLLDNLRNSCLLLYSMLFQAATISTSSQPYWKRLLRRFEPYVTASVGLYYSALTLDLETYRLLLPDLRRAASGFYELRNVARLLYTFLEGNKIDEDKIIRQWREVDHPGEVLAALRVTRQDLHSLMKSGQRVCALGLMYGGIELPFALRFEFVGTPSSDLVVAHLGGISFYRRERGALIMEQYAHDILESAIPNADRLEEVLAPGDIAVIMDDNVTTGRTIELARDRLLSYGVNVPFTVCVRYPPEHRIIQMAMRRHGGIDPDSLGKDVRGLVSQSPYSRIFSTESGYEDALGVFDLSREHVERYLKKNGIVSEED